MPEGDERDGGIRARYVPVDGGMVPLAEAYLPLRVGTQGMVCGGRYVGTEHAEKVKAHAQCGPSVMFPETPYQENHAEDNAHDDACGMTPGVPQLFLMRVIYLHFVI